MTVQGSHRPRLSSNSTGVYYLYNIQVIYMVPYHIYKYFYFYLIYSKMLPMGLNNWIVLVIFYGVNIR